MTEHESRPVVFLVRLQATTDTDGIRALRRDLKYLRRVCGLKALSAEQEVSGQSGNAAEAHGPGNTMKGKGTY